ncbi:MAG TPA: hypothetical protein VFR81_18450 [Longimicrobium sp.]|nr:hypothetical protein [Longimicrobium sp.]
MAEEIRVREGRESERRTEGAREQLPADMDVRDQDMEPHEGLRYIARLFKLLSVLLLLLLVGEVVIGIMRQGNDALPTLMVEATRIIVFAGLLWGAADMALMLIESNHDLRATRILVGRLNGKVARLEAAFNDGGANGPPRPGGPRPEGPRGGFDPGSRPGGPRLPSHQE